MEWVRKKVNGFGTLWKSMIIGGLALMLVGSFVFSDFADAKRARDFIYELHVYKVFGLTVDPAPTVELFDATTTVDANGFTFTGNLNAAGSSVSNFQSTPNIVYIDDVDDLSSWTNTDSGQSYYQANPGETVLVDVQAIYESADPECQASCVTGFITTDFTGVTIHAPFMAEADTEQEFTVAFVVTGNTGYALSGLTTVYVYGAPSSGVTDYAYTAGGTNLVSGNYIQTLQIGSTRFLNTHGRAIPDSELTVMGNSKTWRAQYNSAVSYFITAEVNM